MDPETDLVLLPMPRAEGWLELKIFGEWPLVHWGLIVECKVGLWRGWRLTKLRINLAKDGEIPWYAIAQLLRWAFDDAELQPGWESAGMNMNSAEDQGSARNKYELVDDLSCWGCRMRVYQAKAQSGWGYILSHNEDYLVGWRDQSCRRPGRGFARLKA